MGSGGATSRSKKQRVWGLVVSPRFGQRTYFERDEAQIAQVTRHLEANRKEVAPTACSENYFFQPFRTYAN